MKTFSQNSAFTVSELMISVAVGAMAMAAAFSGTVSMQRCIVAAEDFAADKGEQTRLNDYLALDLRRALTVQGPDGTNLLTLTIPDFYDADGKPATPEVIRANGSYVATYGTTPLPVVYRKYKSTITRSVNGGPQQIIAENVEDFECVVDGIGSGNVVETRITFQPGLNYHRTASDTNRRATTVYNTVRLRNKQ